MRRILAPVLILGLLSSSVVGLVGCDAEAGTQQITEKFTPDQEIAAKPARSVRTRVR